MRKSVTPTPFKPFTYIEIDKPLKKDHTKNQFIISTIVKVPKGFKLQKSRKIIGKDGYIKKVLIVFKETKHATTSYVGTEEFFFKHKIKFSEINCSKFDEGIPVQVVAPHDPAGRPIFHDGTSRPHPGDGD